mmetsp:Transcript_87578/g.272165  ORF Transcript_87578/g.272165 Transcript_87578/m.272165 type:complete len:259 (-) Transcript_87578:859-1635(-)
MGFFRLGKLDRGGKEEKDKLELSPDREKRGAEAESVASSVGSANAAQDGKESKPEKSKKKSKDSDGGGSSSGANEGRAASGVPARVQAGLSVNDFISKTRTSSGKASSPRAPSSSPTRGTSALTQWRTTTSSGLLWKRWRLPFLRTGQSTLTATTGSSITMPRCASALGPTPWSTPTGRPTRPSLTSGTPTWRPRSETSGCTSCSTRSSRWSMMCTRRSRSGRSTRTSRGTASTSIGRSDRALGPTPGRPSARSSTSA